MRRLKTRYEFAFFCPCKLLNGANIEQKERQMVLAATKELKYQEMIISMKRIFAASVNSSSATQGQILKAEPTFAVIEDSTDSVLFVREKAVFRGRRSHRPQQQIQNEQKGTNPLDEHGRVTTCSVCGSRLHWVGDCPEKNSVPTKKLFYQEQILLPRTVFLLAFSHIFWSRREADAGILRLLHF